MKKNIFLLRNQAIFLLSFVLFSLSLVNTSVLACEKENEIDQGLFFIENKGQWVDNVEYLLQVAGARVYLEKDRITYKLISRESMDAIHAWQHSKEKPPAVQMVDFHAIYVKFLNANPNPEIDASCLMDAYQNYFIGNDPSKWASKATQYRQIDYRSIYNGIDMRLYGVDGFLKYDFIVEPGADVSQIGFEYEGADKVYVYNGNLILGNTVRDIIEEKPYAYQLIDGQLQEVACEFSVHEGQLSFVFPKGYDENEELIIDPTLVFASLSGSTTDNWGFSATNDSKGHLYAGSVAFDMDGYPTTTGAYQENFAGGQTDIAITKFSLDGSALDYSTHIGGLGSTEMPHSLVINNKDELIVFGTASASTVLPEIGFPTTVGAYSNEFNGGNSITINNINYNEGSDIIIAKFSSDGSQLLGSTYYGGSANDGLNNSNVLKYNYADEARGSVFVDDDGYIYIATSTSSDDIEITNNSFQTTINGGQDGIVAKFSPDLTTLEWASYLGGSTDDAAYSIALDDAGIIYVGGGTTSTDFPGIDGGFDSTLDGVCDGFAAKISNDGSSLEQATLMGYEDYDQAYFIDVDLDGGVYTMGQTESAYPVSDNVYSNDNSGQFIHKFANDLKTDEWSTVYGNKTGEPNISPTAFLVDNCKQIFVAGWGSDILGGLQAGQEQDIPLSSLNMATTADAIQPTTDGHDFHFIVLGENATSLIYATYFGGATAEEHVDGGTSRFDKAGIIYEAICASCGPTVQDFPATPGAWEEQVGSGNCNIGVVKFDTEVSPTIADFVLPPGGCAPYTYTFENISVNATTYEWDFAGLGNSTEENPTFTFDTPGMYEITLNAVGEGTCIQEDQTKKTFEVFGPADPDFTGLNSPYCGLNDEAVTLIPNTPGGTFSGTGVDGDSFVPANIDPSMSGQEITITYEVTDANGCSGSSSQTVVVNFPPDPDFTPQDFCASDASAVFTAVTNGGTWGGGDFINANGEFDPAASGIGEFMITYTVGETGCTAQASKTVTVNPEPELTYTTECVELNSTAYTVMVEISSDGDGPFEIIGAFNDVIDNNTGGPYSLTGDDDSYNIVVTDQSNNCSQSFTIDSPDCPFCDPDAGTMGTDIIVACNNETVSAQTSGEKLEDGQELYYIVHTNTTNEPGTILALNQSGIFSFDDLDNGNYYTTYYISPVVSYPDPNNGEPMYDDACTRIAAGQPILFLEPVSLDIDTWCDWKEGDFYITIKPAGGYAEYDANASYVIEGSITNETLAFGETAQVVIPENSGENNYSFTIIDDRFDVAGAPSCGIPYQDGDDYVCYKTPIELVSFTATAKDDGNFIEWISATETDNDYYILEASHDLSAGFTKIAQLDGAGNSFNELTYNYLDKNTECGTTYYRLAWVDYNGIVEYSQIISVSRNGGQLSDILIVPVPAKDVVSITFPASNKEANTIEVFDLSGKRVLFESTKGNDCTARLTVDVSHLSTGMYLLKAGNGQQTYTTKMIVE